MLFLLKKIKTWHVLLILGLALLGIFTLAWQRPGSNLNLYFLDVGQGDAIFIKTPANQQILVDGGPDKTVITRLGEVLAFNDRDLDLLVLTHPHADHVTGLIEVLERFKVKKVLLTGVVHTTDVYQTFLEMIEKQGIEAVAARRGQAIDFGDGVKMKILWPPPDYQSENLNPISIVIQLDYNQFSALLLGDAPEEVQSEFLDSLKAVDVLKVAHQGAKDALAEGLLGKVQPKLAVISVGVDNRFGHPAKETLEKLEAAGAVIKRTDQDGTIKVVSDGKIWWLE